MSDVVFVTPAHGRPEVSRVVFGQRKAALEALKGQGYDARCVVIACDGNLNLAEEFGFRPVQFTNQYLGQRWNVGYREAANLKARYAMPLGSDSLLDPALIAHWLSLDDKPGLVPFTTHYSVVRKDGRRRLDCVVTRGGGGGMMLPTELLAPLGYQPVKPRIQRGCDHSTMQAISRYRRVEFEPHDVHQLSVVALQSQTQITSYEKLKVKWAVHEELETPLDDLEPVYGPELLGEVKSLYGVT